MNTLEILQKLRRRLGNLDPSQVPDATLLEHINEAYNHILDRYPMVSARTWFKFSTVVGTSTYGLPGSAGTVRNVWDIAMRRRLGKALDRDVGSWGEDFKGRPTHYLRSSGSIVLFPEPNLVIEPGDFDRIGCEVPGPEHRMKPLTQVALKVTQQRGNSIGSGWTWRGSLVPRL